MPAHAGRVFIRCVFASSSSFSSSSSLTPVSHAVHPSPSSQIVWELHHLPSPNRNAVPTFCCSPSVRNFTRRHLDYVE
jgi:hypothetical protein